MDRLACVDLPDFSLQILLRLHPDWQGYPAAVVARESAQGEILVACPRAKKRGVFPGLRYGTALARAPELRVGAVSPVDLKQGAQAVLKTLRNFSPDVEPDKNAPGTFWLNAAGLDRLAASLGIWARRIRASLRELGFDASLAVGFSRFGTYALARALRGLLVLKSPEDENARIRDVPLAGLGIPPMQLAGLTQLGKRTLGDLLSLPGDGLLERFGPEVHKLRALAAGDLWDPLQPLPSEEPLEVALDLDHPEYNTLRLTFVAKRLLNSLLRAVSARSRAVLVLEITLQCDRGASCAGEVRPAEPTLDETQLIDLVRLRFESLDVPGGVVAIRLTAKTVPATREQLSLFSTRPRRDSTAANRALARLRAEFGEQSVVRMRLTEGHLPEAQYCFEPLSHLKEPAAKQDSTAEASQPGRERALVRRIYTKPIPLQARPVVGPRGCHLLGLGEAPASRTFGPYIIAGGWWVKEVEREYYFTETADGQILWVYFDRKRRCWFLHGEVE